RHRYRWRPLFAPQSGYSPDAPAGDDRQSRAIWRAFTDWIWNKLAAPRDQPDDSGSGAGGNQPDSFPRRRLDGQRQRSGQRSHYFGRLYAADQLDADLELV